VSAVADARPKAPMWLYPVLGFFLIFFLIPVYVVLVTSMKSPADVGLATMWQLPRSFDVENYRIAWSKLGPAVINSFQLVVPAAIIASILGSLNGFVLSKWKFPGADIVFPLILFGMFIPYQSVLIPLVITMREIGLYGGLPGLALVHIIYGLPITTLIFRNYYASIPNELIEAARVDGAGMLGTYLRVILPLSAPAFIVCLIWEFTSIWNDFLFAVVLTGQNSWPVTVALNNIAGSQIVQWNVQMAGALIASLPTIVVYIFLGRYFLRGMMAGSLKG
jgi:glucose/mannose transport system permease protein